MEGLHGPGACAVPLRYDIMQKKGVMAVQVVTQGVVLREVSYQEADKILTVLTKDLGKVTVRARGCRRRNNRLTAAAQLLVYADLTLTQRGDRWELTDADTRTHFWAVRQDLEKLALASYFAEVSERVCPEGEEADVLLSLLLNSFYALNSLEKPQALVKAVFELRLLSFLGMAPLLEGCPVCGVAEPKQAFLHLREGVLCCAACRRTWRGTSVPLSPAALTAARYILTANPKKLFSFALDAGSLAQLSHASEAFLITQLDRGFQTLDYYRGVRG